MNSHKSLETPRTPTAESKAIPWTWLVFCFLWYAATGFCLPHAQLWPEVCAFTIAIAGTLTMIEWMPWAELLTGAFSGALILMVASGRVVPFVSALVGTNVVLGMAMLLGMAAGVFALPISKLGHKLLKVFDKWQTFGIALSLSVSGLWLGHSINLWLR